MHGPLCLGRRCLRWSPETSRISPGACAKSTEELHGQGGEAGNQTQLPQHIESPSPACCKPCTEGSSSQACLPAGIYERLANELDNETLKTN